MFFLIWSAKASNTLATSFLERSVSSAMLARIWVLVGAFAAAFLLYGIALVYGATGTTNLEEIARYIEATGLGTNPRSASSK